MDGWLVGAVLMDGNSYGINEGNPKTVGKLLGWPLGCDDGYKDGHPVGKLLGWPLGCDDG